MKPTKVKKFDLDREMETLGDWSASGGVWIKQRATEGVKSPDCTAKKPCLRTGWYTFGGPETEVSFSHVEFSVSTGHAVVVQGLDDAFRARLIAAAPDLLRFVRSIADGEAATFGVVDEAKSLMKSMREPVRVPGLHDYTAPLDGHGLDDRLESW